MVQYVQILQIFTQSPYRTAKIPSETAFLKSRFIQPLVIRSSYTTYADLIFLTHKPNSPMIFLEKAISYHFYRITEIFPKGGSVIWINNPDATILTVSPAEEVKWSGEADMVVVGFGGAGVVAALQAREDGATVIAVDRFEGGGAT